VLKNISRYPARRDQIRSDIDNAIEQLSTQNLIIVDEPVITVDRISGVARRYRRQHGQLSAIFIDYLQLLEPTDNRAKRIDQVSAMSRSLKLMARSLGVPVIVLAQLNREAESERPKLKNLRESGAIEQDADVVMFIHREKPYHTTDPKVESDQMPIVEIIVAKNRNGRTGSTNSGSDRNGLAFHRPYAKFVRADRTIDDTTGDDTIGENDDNDGQTERRRDAQHVEQRSIFDNAPY
jgi:replicative DNA helicase